MIDIPPPEFDRPAEMHVWQYPAERAADICERLVGFRVPACASGSSHGTCIIILPDNASDALYRHERAHCNGWRH